ncbi:MAG: TlpA disulfide reductase family protein [Pyrinomonadaceae bacterium]
MKIPVKLFVIFCLLTFVLSLSFGCGGAETEVSKVENTSNGSDRKSESDKSDEYPAPPEKIATTEFKLTDGGTFSLEKSKGKVVLINLWATWCGPCRKEMPELVAMQDKYRDKGFEIIGLDVDPESKEDIAEFSEEMKLNYKLGWSEKELVEEFFKLGQMEGIPQSFLINRNGKLTGIFQGGSKKVVEKMKETVDGLMSE